MSEREQFRGDIYRSVSPPVELIERAEDKGGPMLSGRFAVFNRWTEINNASEGHFLERVAPGAFKKTLAESLQNIRVVLSHGMDRALGASVLGKLESAQEDSDFATYQASLFRSVPSLLVDGLRAGVYGASFRGDPIKNDVVMRPDPSPENPLGLPEVTRQEIRLKDIGPTPFAQYSDTTSLVRSDNDHVLAVVLFDEHTEELRKLLQQGAATLDREEAEPDAIERTTPSEDEPTHSAEDVPEPENLKELPSWQLRRRK